MNEKEFVIYCHYEKDYIMASDCFPCEECPDNYKIGLNEFVEKFRTMGGNDEEITA